MTKYNIEAKVFESGEGLSFREGFRDVNGLVADGLEALFPIVRVHHSEPWEPLGTGFFISNNGLFVTAKHVLLERETGCIADSLVGVHIARSREQVMPRDIYKVVVHPTADVAVGFLADRERERTGVPTVNKLFALSRRVPQPGDKVASFGFGAPTSVPTDDPNEFGFLFTVEASSGIIEDHFPIGRDRNMLPGHCFQTTMNTLPGASGGPVAYKDASTDGLIFAVNSTGIMGVPDLN